MTEPALAHRYTLRRLLSESRLQLPRLVRGRSDVIPGLTGAERIDRRTRLVAQLRMARVMGCPVCVGLFPPLARRAGLDDDAIRSALDGRADGLTPEQLGAATWVAALVEGDGEPPPSPPQPALALSQVQRNHLLFFVRMELVVHATGLMFLPHRWIERAREP